MIARSILIAAFCAGSLAGPAFAHRTGISGFSGKSGVICNNCHSGGLTPTVTMEGPAATPPGWMLTYVLRITGGQKAFGGLDVAASAGTLVASDGGTQLLNGEVTHIGPRAANANGEVAFKFDWQAPAALGPQRLWGAGNSVNGNGFNTGDAPDSDTLAVEVRELAFDGFPNTVPAGGTVNLRTFGGQPGGFAALATVDVNGIPFFQFLLTGTFDNQGEWLLSSPVPPGVSGLNITFMSFGLGAISGKVAATNLETLAFQ